MTGGIGGISERYTIDGTGPTWTVERGWHTCETDACPNRVSGPLDAGVARELFASLDGWFFRLRSDYGETRDAADLFMYEISVRRDGRTKTVKGDDMSVPEPVHRLVSEVRRIILEAEQAP
jgi:hypothetical protein